MSTDLGNELPDSLYRRLTGRDGPNTRGKAIAIASVDREGWAHPALLSYREVTARDSSTLQVVTFANSTTTANMRANGKLTLIFIDERMAYYVKGTAQEIRDERTAARGFATMEVAIDRVLEDAPGPGEEAAFITSGITFNEAHP